VNLGVGKVYIDRISWYVSKIQMLMVAWLFFRDVGWSWWYTVILLSVPFVLWVERKYVLPQETNYVMRKAGVKMEDK
jgi:hypothetical protein